MRVEYLKSLRFKFMTIKSKTSNGIRMYVLVLEKYSPSAFVKCHNAIMN